MEIDYNELFGGEEETETADPSVEETEAEQPEEGAKEAEPAEPQSKEDNAKFAAIRRKAEEEAAAKAQKQMDESFAALNMTNPYTGKAIKSKADFDEYAKASHKEKKDTVLEQTGWTDEQLQAFIDEQPDVKAAKAERQSMERERQQRELETQLTEVAKLDPSVKTLEDLQKQDNYADIYNLVVRKGLSISEAYKLANFDKLSSQRASSAAKQAERNAKGKEHLQPTSQRGEGAMSVPQDVMDMYKMFMPDATSAEITAHYNQHHRKD